MPEIYQFLEIEVDFFMAHLISSLQATAIAQRVSDTSRQLKDQKEGS